MVAVERGQVQCREAVLFHNVQQIWTFLCYQGSRPMIGLGETISNKRNLKLPRIKQSYGRRLFMFSAASLWNRLPEELLYLDVFRKQT